MAAPDAPALVVAPGLESWNMPSKTWLSVNDKHFNGLASAALVFHSFPSRNSKIAGAETGEPSTRSSREEGEEDVDGAGRGVGGVGGSGETKVLLLQRAPHDSMPLRWEPPGGAVDAEDASILAGCARELLEEAGLRAARVVRIVERPGGVRDVFTNRTGIKILCRFTFEVDVEFETTTGGEPAADAEVDVHGDQGQLQRHGQRQSHRAPPVVKLDPKEHVDWYWASRDEVEKERREGGEKLPLTSAAAKEILLRGFEMRES